MSVRPKVRFDVFKRDEFTCRYCGRTPPTVTLQLDHVIPRKEGGTDEIDNLATSCADCNQGKGAVPLSQQQSSKVLAQRRQEEMERAEQLDAYNQFLEERRDATDIAIEELCLTWREATSHKRPRSKAVWFDRMTPDHISAMRKFLRLLPKQLVVEAIEIACSRLAGEDNATNRFKYFCGVCWRTIKIHGAAGDDAK